LNLSGGKMKNRTCTAAVFSTISITLCALAMNTTKFYLRHYLFPIVLIFFPLLLDSGFKYKRNIVSPGVKGLKLFLTVSFLVVVFYPVLFFFYWISFKGYSFMVPSWGALYDSVIKGLFAVVVAAIPEEFFFRGYLQEHVFKKFTRKIIGIITMKNFLTSILFGVVHAVAFLDITRAATFFPSLLFGLFTEKSKGSLFYSILFHTFSNILAFILWDFVS
jgi:membrane protease YdiL (CAAX protease family)